MTKQNERTKKRRQNMHKKIIDQKKQDIINFTKSIDPLTHTGQCIINLNNNIIYDGIIENEQEFELVEKESTSNDSWINSFFKRFNFPIMWS